MAAVVIVSSKGPERGAYASLRRVDGWMTSTLGPTTRPRPISKTPGSKYFLFTYMELSGWVSLGQGGCIHPSTLGFGIAANRVTSKQTMRA